MSNVGGVLRGVVLSDTPVVDAGGGVRYDWLGIAARRMQAAGGMTLQDLATPGAATALTGLDGVWSVSAAEFAQVATPGLLGFRVSGAGGFDDLYLRIDGQYPMRGNLNMGNYNVDNANDINFVGWLNGNNALINTITSGQIFNYGVLETQGIKGVNTPQGLASGVVTFAHFEKLIGSSLVLTPTLEASGVNVLSGDDLTIGTGQNSRLFVRDIRLDPQGNPGTQSAQPQANGVNRNAAAWLSDRVSGWVVQDVIKVSSANAGAVINAPVCATSGLPDITLQTQDPGVSFSAVPNASPPTSWTLSVTVGGGGETMTPSGTVTTWCHY